MKFKKNITNTFAFFITEFYIMVELVCFLAYLIYQTFQIDEFFSDILFIIHIILITNVILIIVSFIANFFIKTQYYVKDNCLIIENKTDVKEIAYNEIAEIVYEDGYINKSSHLMLYDNEHKQLLYISNPSLIMVCLIKRKCKQARFRYHNHKRFLIMILTSIGGAILVFILEILGSTG